MDVEWLQVQQMTLGKIFSGLIHCAGRMTVGQKKVLRNEYLVLIKFNLTFSSWWLFLEPPGSTDQFLHKARSRLCGCWVCCRPLPISEWLCGRCYSFWSFTVDWWYCLQICLLSGKYTSSSGSCPLPLVYISTEFKIQKIKRIVDWLILDIFLCEFLLLIEACGLIWCNFSK